MSIETDGTVSAGETKAFYVLCQSHGTHQPGLNPSPNAANMSAEIEHLELSRVVSGSY